MAVRCGKMAADCDDSSSEDEALQRCREAVWDAQTFSKKDEDNEGKQSKRLVVADHEHDGNELQVTQGFRTHVAKKLVHFLDSYISEMLPETSPSAKSPNGDNDDDEGFRLFSTSVPGQGAEEPPTPVRRRPVPSSSDSDSEMEMRLREAAVSVTDLLPSLSLPEPSTAIKNGKKKKAEGEESHAIKKKKKRKDNEEERELKIFGSPPQSDGTQEPCEQDDGPLKVKKKKKKKKKKVDGEESEQVFRKSGFADSPPHRPEDQWNSEQQTVKKKKRKKSLEVSD